MVSSIICSKHLIKSFLAFLFLLFIQTSCKQEHIDFNPIKYVNPFIGTLEMGNTYPGAQAPFGMISISPNTVFENYQALDSYDSRPGYSYAHDKISGFSLTHFSGIGCHALQDLPVTFTTHKLTNSPVNNKHLYAHQFEKQNEHASPGYYGVVFKDNFSVYATTAIRSGMIHVKNESGNPMHFILNPNGAANGITDSELYYDYEKNSLSGWARSGGFCDRNPEIHPYTIYFAIQFLVEPIEVGVWDADQIITSQNNVKGKEAVAFLTFADTEETLLLKVAISYVSTNNAIENLQTEIPDWDFNNLKNKVAEEWKTNLRKIEIKDEGREDEKITFYTALYHNMLQPSIFQDNNGQYIGFDDQIHQAPDGRDVYTNFSLWDTYRTTVQLQSKLFPDRVSDMVNSLLLFTQQSHGGLPVWTLNNIDNGVMNGYSAFPFIANAYAFGAINFDLDLAIQLMKRAAEEELPIKDGRGWEELALYQQYGYLPANLVPRYSVSKNIEYSIADYALAQLCLAAGDKKGYTNYLERSKNIFNNLHPESGYFQPRNTDGSWHEPFDPKSTFGFNEGNAAQYNLSIAYHFDETLKYLGDDVIEQKLDSLTSKILAHGWFVRELYYWLGNEPVFGVNYIYNLLGKPEKNDIINSKILAQFKTGPNGLAGNDDAGALSALFVWTALGKYPLFVGKDTLIISKPLFRQVEGL